MHEFSITRAAVEVCEQVAQGRTVTGVVLEIGTLSGVEPGAVSFCFEACTKGTLLEGARLTIERTPGQGRCECGNEFTLYALYDPCPICGGYGVEIVSGTELKVRELEVDEDVHDVRLPSGES